GVADEAAALTASANASSLLTPETTSGIFAARLELFTAPTILSRSMSALARSLKTKVESHHGDVVGFQGSMSPAKTMRGQGHRPSWGRVTKRNIKYVKAGDPAWF